MHSMRLVFAAAAIALAASACAHSKIRGTQIDDTPENREVLEVISSYQNAMQGLDADAVLALISPSFYEDNGNTDKSDDYDIEGLRSTLTADFARTKKIQLELRIDEVVVEESKAFAYVQYTYRAQSEYPTGLKWKTDTDRTRFELERRDDKWLIVRGL
jgi:ketosteroid isomerase-like protein